MDPDLFRSLASNWFIGPIIFTRFPWNPESKILNDDFEENAAHLRPKDKIVFNDYEYGGIKNPHKSYGYLRTLEMAEIIDDFLNPKEW